ncbi:hypothetical protein A3N42_02610 [Klebsiella aerogenes]|uniref:hypothetical protein n=1 Tax=Klebsiella aerogenes TaxID=548 RepID=UPI00069C4FBB|nr:hypothetical protein [Klebsiella aerogenes]KZQ03399.1 hypothetical protein A3N42_02610 [Klebsiella aerogenes]HBV6392177.1 hypothetical protein [Klebsiella aerogenes]
MKIVVRITLLFTCIAPLYLSAVYIMLTLSKSEYYSGINQRIETALSSASGASEPDLTLMSHRMITSDMQDGLISPQNAKKAFSNTAGFFNEVKRACLKESTQKTKDILSCANKTLGNHFYYYPARETASAWAGHYSDCDSNVYLLLDVLQLFNKTASIVYAPGHAFLSWTDEQTGLPAWWETTSDENHGRMADLSRDDLYRKTLGSFYYRPQSAHYAEQFYASVVTLESLPPESKQERLDLVARRYPGNPFVDDIRYSLKKPLTETDISLLHAQLQADVSSVTKKYLLANYYLEEGNKALATDYISKIDIDNCDTECRPLMIMAHPLSRIWFMASDFFSEETLNNEFGTFAISKLTIPASSIQRYAYGVAILFILILSLRGVLALYSDLKSIHTTKKSGQ